MKNMICAKIRILSNDKNRGYVTSRIKHDDSAASARAAIHTTPVLFYLQAIMDYKKRVRREGGWAGREGGNYRKIVRCVLLSTGRGWAVLLFQPIRYFSPHQLVLRR